MAEALVNHDLAGQWTAWSAGTVPAAAVHPMAVQVLREEGIDISGNVPKHVRTFAGQRFDIVITVCDNARKTCPVWLGPEAHIEHIGLPDPASFGGSEEEQFAVFRRTRDQIRDRILGFLGRWGHEPERPDKT